MASAPTTHTADLSRIAGDAPPPADADAIRREAPPPTIWRMAMGSRRVVIGGGILLFIVLACVGSTVWTCASVNGVVRYEVQDTKLVRESPKLWPPSGWFGYDTLGRSVLVRSLVGGLTSLGVGAAAATISVVLGVMVGLLAGYRGGWVDASLMRVVDVMYGLPYVLLVILFKIAFEQPLIDGITAVTAAWLALLIAGFVGLVSVPPTWSSAPRWAGRAVCLGVMILAGVGMALWHPAHGKVLFQFTAKGANLVVLFLAIGLVSWLTMSRVVRGQVLSLRGQPFVEACRAMGLKERRIFLRHILPNLVGPITVYATLTVPSAILQESFLSFLGVGVNPPLATWGSLASDGVQQLSPLRFYWWLLVFPCSLLAVTLLSLNFLGDGLRDVFDPRKEAAKI